MVCESHIIVISGFSGTGKTSISKELYHAISSTLISVDEVEKALLKSSIQNAEQLKYPHTLSLAYELLQHNRNVILDGNFRYRATRNKILNSIYNTRSKYFLIQCDCSENEAEKRIQLRNRLQPGFYKKTASYRYSKELFDPINEYPYLKLNTNKPIQHCVQEIIQYIQN